ncbi:MAG TPA: dienelactone hydrolase family protein, partial [Stellaceae bacterium]
MDRFDNEFQGLVPRTQWSRRGFVMTSLITGFALSMQPVSAETITTDTNGLDAGEVKVPVADGSIPAYRAMPAQGGPFPTVLVVQEIFGVHEHIKDICRRLAKAGYYAIAPELYAR